MLFKVAATSLDNFPRRTEYFVGLDFDAGPKRIVVFVSPVDEVTKMAIFNLPVCVVVDQLPCALVLEVLPAANAGEAAAIILTEVVWPGRQTMALGAIKEGL